KIMSDPIINLLIIIILVVIGVLLFAIKPNIPFMNSSSDKTTNINANKNDNYNQLIDRDDLTEKNSYPLEKIKGSAESDDSYTLDDKSESFKSINNSIKSIDDIVKIKKLNNKKMKQLDDKKMKQLDDKKIKKMLCSLKKTEKRCESKLEFVDIKLQKDYFD